MEKIIQFEKNQQRYRKLAEQRASKEDFVGALSLLFSVASENSYSVFADIADVYADMGLLDLSNKYWFKYIDSAPKDKVSIAYEELAINFFYLDNLWASGYYFHQKLAVDGFISKEGLDQEIIEFFSGEEIKNNAFKIVYPPERADFSFEHKCAKRALGLGGFEEAIKIISKIPEGSRTEEISGDLALSLFMCDRLDEAEIECRSSLARHGDNVTAYCNLSTVYDMKEDYEKSDYYYQKALACTTGERGDAYKIATCAIERQDHERVKECIEKILKERANEQSMMFFLAQAQANLGNFYLAEQTLKKVIQIDPFDSVSRFYYDYVKRLANGEGDSLSLLPFKYVKELPESITTGYAKKLLELIKTPQKIATELKKATVKEMVEWGLYSEKSEVMRACVYILITAYTPYAKRLLKQTLLNPEGREELKRVITYILTLKGCKDRLGIVAGNVYFSVKARRLQCEKEVEGSIYFNAYALCLSRIIFYDIDDFSLLASVTDKVYKKLKGKVSEQEVSNEDLGALIMSLCKYKHFTSEREILRVFESDKQMLKTLQELYKGEKND